MSHRYPNSKNADLLSELRSTRFRFVVRDIAEFFILSHFKVVTDSSELNILGDVAELDASTTVVVSTNCSGAERRFTQCPHRTGRRDDQLCDGYIGIFCIGQLHVSAFLHHAWLWSLLPSSLHDLM